MRNNIRLTFIGLMAMSCLGYSRVGSDDVGDPVPMHLSTPTAVETWQTNISYPSSLIGQTQISGVRTSTMLQNRIIKSFLSAPWGAISIPDGRFLVTKKSGAISVVTQTGSLMAPITGIIKVNSNGQGGLLALGISQDFSSDRMAYWVFSENAPRGNRNICRKWQAIYKRVDGANLKKLLNSSI